ncbi:hypothetical protein OKA05_08005 [Luteolibacter arcticus]|uniref:Uncharacterized protein n=1 Tax=Luteolibacter arcticus TaxID=1581411 RepID=A0ABT3GFU7_9BACT|nr:hypothetical protein [Luteolibacter arcticus]MCW1922495.1 hypothetical protein [Luteolibacter arcticus]
MPSASEIQALALKLPLRSRFKLAGELLRSVGPAVTADDLLEEATRRDDGLESGETTALSESEFWSGIRSRRTA